MSYFSELKDPRVNRTRKFELMEVIVTALCAVIVGCDGWASIVRFVTYKKKFFQIFLRLKNGIPSEDRYARIFSLIDAKVFEECFAAWMNSVSKRSEGELVVIDGKSVKRSFDTFFNKNVLKLVSAFSAKNQVVLG